MHIYSNNPDGMARAKQIINGMTKEIEVGEIYQGRVVTIKEFGCFVEVMPGKDGLCHISELADFRVNRSRRRRQGRRHDLGQVHRRGRKGPRQTQPQSRDERAQRSGRNSAPVKPAHRESHDAEERFPLVPFASLERLPTMTSA